MTQPAELLTAAEVAAIFRVQPRTVLRWIQRGRLPAVRVGGSPRIPREHLNARLANAAAA